MTEVTMHSATTVWIRAFSVCGKSFEDNRGLEGQEMPKTAWQIVSL